MVVFSERLDKLGAVVTSWDPSVLAPLKTNFMLTVLDAEYVESPVIHEDALVVGRSAYVPDGSDEVLAVVKLQQKQDTFWTALRVYLEGSPSRYAMLGNLDRSQNDCYPLFTVMCLAVSSVMRGDGLLPSGVAEPKPYKQALSAPDSDEWVAAVDKEMSSLVSDKKALEMVDFSDVPASARVLNMTLILKVYHMDVETAFLNSELLEVLYVRLPSGLRYDGRSYAG
ncbi:hypothetical protein CYMTET_17424 [Cymbomonas tetramitiformis]|uniref:Reverse transcriptase Ty1/copia-type domain-containing protein n=1 Tax=Cymbomonas tetramitiformis TaxID=36881 RepID=A0AAE0G9X7_9CHLO|nr:hypothetical protein CYMTET_17424 [Cymbomonas tetramitiformis]